MMRIVELTTHRTPIAPDVCVLVLRSDEGLVGLGESFWGAEAVEAYLHATAAPILSGLADVTPAAAGVALRPYAGFAGSGAEMRGIGAVDIALWDLLGRACGRSVMRLLGGPVVPRLRVYNTCAGYGLLSQEYRLGAPAHGLPAAVEADRP